MKCFGCFLGFASLFVLINLSVFAQDSPKKAPSALRMTLSDTIHRTAAKTVGDFSFLEYGMGEDRLGGAKMTFLDTGIVLNVVDSVGSRYKVQLSRLHHAFIPKNNVEIVDPVAVREGINLTQSWHVSGDENYDYLRVALDKKLPYRSMQQINPNRIVLDVFGATSNTNWITQLKSAKEIKNVYHEQVEEDVFRVIIELNSKQHWGYQIYYQGSSLVVRVKRHPERFRMKNLKIAVDAGHGGSATGAVGSTGAQEKEYTLLFAKELEALLARKGIKTVMTRTEDVDVSMTERLNQLREEDPTVLISLHLNSASRESAKGVSTYYRYIGFKPMTEYILDRMLDLGLDEFGNIGSFNFSLSGPTEYPNCLVEIAFISNKDDEQRIMDPKFHKQVAKQIYKGIRDWLKASRN